MQRNTLLSFRVPGAVKLLGSRIMISILSKEHLTMRGYVSCARTLRAWHTKVVECVLVAMDLHGTR
jgi:hypothetical protein